MFNLPFLMIMDVLLPLFHMGAGPRIKNPSNAVNISIISTGWRSNDTIFRTRSVDDDDDEQSEGSNKTTTSQFSRTIPKRQKFDRPWARTAAQGDVPIKSWKKLQEKFQNSNTSTQQKMVERSRRRSFMATERARKANITARNAEIECAQIEADVAQLKEEVKRLGSVARNTSCDAARCRTKVEEVRSKTVEAVQLENTMAQKALLARNKEAEARYKLAEAQRRKAEAERLAFRARRKAAQLKWMESFIASRPK